METFSSYSREVIDRKIQELFKTELNASLRTELPMTEHESESGSCLVMSDSLRPHGLYSPWNSPEYCSG